MIVNKTTIYGDFLSSYLYDDMLLLQVADNRLYSINTKGIDSGSTVNFDEYIEKHQPKHMVLDQFITDFDVYYNGLFYCNSSGLFNVKISDMNTGDNVHPDKIWDAPVQCVRVGNNGRVALSLAGEGLYEYDSMGINLYISDKVEVDKRIQQISKLHSTSCRWSNGNWWNYSSLSESSLITFIQQGKHSFAFLEEFKREELFDDIDGNSFVYLSENKKQVNRLLNQSIETLIFSQSNKNGMKRRNKVLKLDNPIDVNNIQEVFEISINENQETLIAYETSNGITVMNFKGEIIHQIKDDSIVSWRVFPKSKKHRNEMHVVFDDRLEIIKFYASAGPDSNSN